MALSIPVPNVSNSVQEVTFDGITYSIYFRYNSRDLRWRISLYLNDVELVAGIKVMENQFLLGRYRLPEFDHGDIICVRSLEDGNDVGRSNFGSGLAYELVYYTNEEIEELLEGE